MNISPVNSALMAVQSASANSVAGQVSMKMLDKTLENSEATNANLVKMMEQSVNPHIGGNIDLSV